MGKKKRSGSSLEEHFAKSLAANDIWGWEREVRFLKKRKFRFDFAWPDKRLAVEIHGGIWMRRGGHTSAAGITRDAIKTNYATLAGWRVLVFVSEDVKSGAAIGWVRAALDRIDSGTLPLPPR